MSFTRHMMVTPDTRKVIQDGEAYAVVRWDVRPESGEGKCMWCTGYNKSTRTVAFVEMYRPARKVSYQDRPVRATHSQIPVCQHHADGYAEENLPYAQMLAESFAE